MEPALRHLFDANSLVNWPPLGQVFAMPSSRFASVTEQVADHLREGLARGRWQKTMPGRSRLAQELGVSRKTVESALNNLEAEGLLLGRGPGRRRLIRSQERIVERRGLRVALLASDSIDLGLGYMIELRHLLEEAGHMPFFPDKTLQALGMDVGRVADFVRDTEADAWVVGAGSRDVLEWFSAEPVPALALFGRRSGLPIAAAGPDKAPVYAAVTRHLLALGHRRISLVCCRRRRLPRPGKPESAFLAELESADIPCGEFNLPDWEESKEGFGKIVESLFRHTPPTALILDEPFLYNAAHHHLAKRGLRVPEDVSLICTDADPGFVWCEPSVAHIRWDYRPVVNRIALWANNVARGKEDRRQTLTKAEFVPGGTIAPPPPSRGDSRPSD
jgi:DNA-binding LacI/PurR family transcriptional regulator